MGLTGNIYANAALGGFLSGYVNTGTINGAITSALTATAFTGVGQNAEVFGGMGSPGHIAAHGVVGCVSGYIGGGGCGHQAFAAAFTKAATPWIGGLPNNPAAQISAAAAIGGTASVIGGGKFRNGAMTGAYGYINNFLLNVAITAMRYSLPLVVSISQSDNIKAGWKALSSKMFSEGADSGDEGQSKPPPDTVPIDGTKWSGDHQNIKGQSGAGATDNTRVGPTGEVWVQQPGGSWVNTGNANDMIGGSEASGRKGKDREPSWKQDRGRKQRGD